jgi:hypothetical protein
MVVDNFRELDAAKKQPVADVVAPVAAPVAAVPACKISALPAKLAFL